VSAIYLSALTPDPVELQPVPRQYSRRRKRYTSVLHCRSLEHPNTENSPFFAGPTVIDFKLMSPQRRTSEFYQARTTPTPPRCVNVERISRKGNDQTAGRRDAAARRGVRGIATSVMPGPGAIPIAGAIHGRFQRIRYSGKIKLAGPSADESHSVINHARFNMAVIREN